MSTASVNGVRLYYESHGSGYPVVFLHGFAGTTNMWKPQVAPLSERYRFITYDARGHGQSESPPSADQYSADIVVEDLRQLLGALKVSRAVVGGLSMGGYESLRFYLRNPALVTALILMDTGPGYRNPARREEWNRQQEERAQLLEEKGIRSFAEDPGTRSLDSYTPRDLMLKQSPVGLAHMGRKVVAQHDSLVIERLGEVKVPTLVLVGDKDTPFLQAADYMAQNIPGARKAVIPNAGHASNIDNPSVFNREVLGFLEGLKLK